jgi:hypothetical protein
VSIEDRVRRVLSIVRIIAMEPRSARASDRVLHRRRLVGATVVLLLFAGVVMAISARDRNQRAATPLTTFGSSGWKQFRDPSRNLSFSYPSEWVVKSDHESPELLSVFPSEYAKLAIPPELADRPLANLLPFVLTIEISQSYYIGQADAKLSQGRLSHGQPYVQFTTAAVISPPQVQPPAQRWYETYSVDWGRSCMSFQGAPRSDCGVHSITATIAAGRAALWDRYRPVAATIVQALTPLRATKPSFGDRTRPSCRPSQWRLVPEQGWSFIPPSRSWLIQGTVLSRGTGPACHLRATLKVSVEHSDGTLLRVPGTPARITIEGDLPEDTKSTSPDDSFAPPTPLTWRWSWSNWCSRPPGRSRIRITGPDGQSATKQLPPLQDYISQGDNPCRGVNQNAPWRISPWPFSSVRQQTG